MKMRQALLEQTVSKKNLPTKTFDISNRSTEEVPAIIDLTDKMDEDENSLVVDLTTTDSEITMVEMKTE